MLWILHLVSTFHSPDFDPKPGPLATARCGTLALAILICVAVVPLTPYGAAMYAYPLETLRSQGMQSYIGEWFSPNFHQYRYLPTLAMILATVALAAAAPRRLRPRDILLLSVTTYAALRSVRHIPIYALVAIPILSTMTLDWLKEHGLTKQFEGKADSDEFGQGLCERFVAGRFSRLSVCPSAAM